VHTVDAQLVHSARRLITGANVHRINMLIFQYEQSVAIHNAGLSRAVDPQHYEKTLSKGDYDALYRKTEALRHEVAKAQADLQDHVAAHHC
jgi:hypothetical protein